jgi:hypothetical protein
MQRRCLLSERGSQRPFSTGAPRLLPVGSVSDPGPQNPAIRDQFPHAFSPPATDVGSMPLSWASFNNAPRRIQNGGWARQVTQDSFAVADTISGVNMRAWRHLLEATCRQPDSVARRPHTAPPAGGRGRGRCSICTSGVLHSHSSHRFETHDQLPCRGNAASNRSEVSKFQFSGSVIRACLLRGDRFKIDPEHHEPSCCNPHRQSG